MVYLGLLPTAIGFTTWAFALQPVIGGTPRVDDLPRPARGDRHGVCWCSARCARRSAIAGGALCIGRVVGARSAGALPWRRAAVADA